MSLCRREVFLKLRVKACFRELKIAATSQKFTKHGFDVQTYLCLLPSYLQRVNYLEKKRPQPKGREITLESNYKIQKYGDFYFEIWRNEMREVLTSRNLQLTARFCLQMVIVTAHY